MSLYIIRKWNIFVPWYYFLPFWHVEFLLFFTNHNIKSCCCIRLVDSNATLYQGPKFWLLHLNSTCESTFSIWQFFLLEFCCKLSVCLYASLIYISQEIISTAWGVLWLAGLSFVHKCFYYNWKSLLGVINC
jgi:hypothetical protein